MVQDQPRSLYKHVIHESLYVFFISQIDEGGIGIGIEM